jgi:hypothetical protein
LKIFSQRKSKNEEVIETRAGGHRTPHVSGKAKSSRNAIKHGLYSERVLPAEENEAVRLHQALRKDLHLQGFEDEFFGTDLVLTELKKRRLDKYACHESRKAKIQAFCEQVRSFELRWYSERDSSSSPNRLHPDLCIVLLEKIKTNIEKRGLNSQEDLPILYSLFSRGDSKWSFIGLSVILLYEMAKLSGVKSDGQSANPDCGELRARILNSLELAIKDEQGTARLELMKDAEDLEAHTLFSDAIADRIMRFENAIQEHTIGQLDLLERYRRLRKHQSKP